MKQPICCGFLALGIVFTLFLAGAGTGIAAQPRFDNNLDFESVEKQLATAEVSSTVGMREYLKGRGLGADFHNEVLLVTLQDDLKAVFKPGEDFHAEVAAYRASRAIETRLVPPTVYRTINGVTGSLQFYVDPDPEYVGRDLTDDQLTKLLGKQTVSEMKLFRFVFGQWDIGAGNQIIQRNGERFSVALIDNAGIANEQQGRYGEFSFVSDRGQMTNLKPKTCFLSTAPKRSVIQA